MKSTLVILAVLLVASQAQTPVLQQLQLTLNGLYNNLSLANPTGLQSCFTSTSAQYFFNMMNDLLMRSQALTIGNQTGFDYYNQEFGADLLDLGPTLPCVFASSDFARLFVNLNWNINITTLIPQLSLFIDAYAAELASFLTGYNSYRQAGYYSNSGAFLGPLVRLLPGQTSNFLYGSLSGFLFGLFTSTNVSFSTALPCLTTSNTFITSALQFYNTWATSAANAPLANVTNATLNYFNGAGYSNYNNAVSLFNCIGATVANSQLSSKVGFGLNFYGTGNQFSVYLTNYLNLGAINWYNYQSTMRLISFYFYNNQTRLAGETLGNWFLSL